MDEKLVMGVNLPWVEKVSWCKSVMVAELPWKSLCYGVEIVMGVYKSPWQNDTHNIRIPMAKKTP